MGNEQYQKLLWIVGAAVVFGLIGAYFFTALARAEERKDGEGIKLWSYSLVQAERYLKLNKIDEALASSQTATEEGGSEDPKVRILRARIYYKKLDIARLVEEATAAARLVKGQTDEDLKREATALLAEVTKMYGVVKIIPAPGFPEVFNCETVNLQKKEVVKIVQERVRSGQDEGPWTAFLPLGEVCHAGNITIEVKQVEAGKEPSIPVPKFTAGGVIASGDPADKEPVVPLAFSLGIWGTFTAGLPWGVSGRWKFYSRPYWAGSLEVGTMYTMVAMPYSEARLGETSILVRARLGPEKYYLALAGGGALAYASQTGAGLTALAAVGSVFHGWSAEIQARVTSAAPYMYWLAPVCVSREF